MTEDNKTLHLILKTKWWDQIISGYKTEEYRDVNYFYCARLLNYVDEEYGLCRMTKYKATEYDSKDGLANGIKDYLKPHQHGYYDGFIKFRDFDKVCFHLGYTNTTIIFEIKEIVIDAGKPEWGAEEGKEYFVIKLGKKLC